jgi:gliding motility-associated protein GldC
MKKNELIITVESDENHLPERITWRTSGDSNEKKARSIMMAVWDEEEMNTLRVDLWLKNMSVEEMKIFFHQNLVSTVETYRRATGDHPTCDELITYLKELGKKMGVLK